MRLGLLRIVLRSELLESVCIESVCIPGVGNAMYIHAQSCYPILSTYPSYLCPNSQPTPRKYSNQNSRSNTKIFQKRESRLHPDSISISQQSQTMNPTRDGTKNIVSCHKLHMFLFCIFTLNYCQHSLEVDVFDSELPALPSSLAFFFSGGASSFMHAFSRMFVHFPLVPAWLCFRCWRK